MTAETQPIGGSFIELQSVDSTNNYAMRQAHEGLAQHGLVVFAHAQTAGKGQRNKAWAAQPGANIMMSVVLEPHRLGLTTPVFLFSMAMAVAAHEVLKKFSPDVKIKWPNDLYIGDRKAGGILIESILSGAVWKIAVAGFGLNINQTDFGDLRDKAVSIKLLTGETYDTVVLAKALCSAIDGVLKLMQTSPQTLAETYHRHLYKINAPVKLKQGTRVFHAWIRGVSPSGQLVVQHAVEERFDVGEVEWVL